MIASRCPVGLGGGAEIVDDLAVGGEVAMGEIQPGDVHPRPQHPLHDLPRLGGRADGADDLGLVIGKLHDVPPLFTSPFARMVRFHAATLGITFPKWREPVERREFSIQWSPDTASRIRCRVCPFR